MSERNLLAVSIDHTEYGWKFGMPCVLWGHRTRDDEKRSFGGYTLYPNCAEIYSLEEWQKSGYGNGEWIILDFDNIYTVKKIKIVNGLVNKKNGYYNNNRPKSLTLQFSDGSSQKINLEDNNTGYQVVNINAVETSYVKFVIDSVYYGTKYDDTCIADIEILGY